MAQAADREAAAAHSVVDDERSMRELLAIVLRREGYDVLLAENGRAAIAAIEREPIDLLISDIKMPDMSGVDVLRAAKRIDQDILGIMITAFASTETAVEAMRLGACDYLSKPFDIDLLKMKVREKVENRQLRQENVLLKRTLGLSHQFTNIIGRSEAMLDVFKMIETVARTNSTILLTGESGTGKGLVAQAIHFHSLRRDKPMVSLNCGAMPETLLESELFGHMRGAFTGAESNKKGLLEVAEKGTIFLDEIGEMSAADAGEAAARAAGAAARSVIRDLCGRRDRFLRSLVPLDAAVSCSHGAPTLGARRCPWASCRRHHGADRAPHRTGWLRLNRRAPRLGRPMAGSGLWGRGWLVPLLLPDPRRVRCFRRNPASCPHPWEDRHRSRRSDCLHADDDRLPPRLQRLPVAQDRPTCRRRRGVERADTGHPQSDRRTHRPRRHAHRRRTALPQTDTFLPPHQ